MKSNLSAQKFGKINFGAQILRLYNLNLKGDKPSEVNRLPL
jgi:hypothetical protein